MSTPKRERPAVVVPDVEGVGTYRVIGHQKDQICPRCRAPQFCDDCACCAACKFCAPKVMDPPYPPWPEPMPTCSECAGTPSHERTCSVTRRAASN